MFVCLCGFLEPPTGCVVLRVGLTSLQGLSWVFVNCGRRPARKRVSGRVSCVSVREVQVNVILALGQYFGIVVIMRLTILATIAIALLFVIMRTNNHQQLRQPAKPHGHKHHPITQHHGRGPCKCMFLWRYIATNIFFEGSFSPGPPFWVHPRGAAFRVHGKELLSPDTWEHPQMSSASTLRHFL